VTPRIAIVGGGAIGQALAADLGRRGPGVAAIAEADPVQRAALAGTALLQLTGLEGSAGIAMPPILASASQAGACDWLLVATTADRHGEVAAAFAPVCADRHVIVLMTGYADGSGHFVRALRQAGCRAEPLVIELNTTPMLAASPRPGAVHIAARKRWMEAAASDFARMAGVIAMLEAIAPGIVAVPDALASSLNNPNPVAHVPAYLMNLPVAHDGAPAGPDASRGGAFHLDDYVFADVTALRVALDAERLAVMAALGMRTITRAEFSTLAYGPASRQPSPPRMGKTFPRRFINEDLPCGLMPIAALARIAGIATPLLDGLVAMAATIAGLDMSAERAMSVASMGGSMITKAETAHARE
jgi:opine dehydrogenase